MLRCISKFVSKTTCKIIGANTRHFRNSNLLYKMTDTSPNTEGTESSHYTVLDVNDWSEKYWKTGQIGFHKDYVHPLLLKYADKLTNGKPAQKILVPLCGKTLDLKWIADQGHTVIGVEAVEQAVVEFFTEQNIEYSKETLTDIPGDLYKSSDGRISLYKCDVFDFNRSFKDKVDAVWDRGALVAINREDRERYADLIKSVSAPASRIFVVTLNYDPTLYGGPPHFVEDELIPKLYGSQFNVEILSVLQVVNIMWRSCLLQVVSSTWRSCLCYR
ncbi:probable thiopurine S-methyltransferase isoform X2 [Haliotis rufescens]|uniref:probable thiopurine S-methyltransferase isoform X2 n=1 Tax=Haliotis rufescens TaxID=6454 RepID=UPI00201F8D10|nr:probable thiopurine S-methyltransferase isoform X2 [Haliotis rufescens]